MNLIAGLLALPALSSTKMEPPNNPSYAMPTEWLNCATKLDAPTAFLRWR
jgi:hypothetical protein